MNLFSLKKKTFTFLNPLSCVTGGVCYGLSSVPWTSIFSEISSIYSQRGWKRTGHPRFVLGSSDRGKRELSVDAKGLLKRKNNGGEIPFEDVVIRWGAWPLKIYDVLVRDSSCGDEKYYVARHIWENDYWLDNGKTVTLTSPSKDFCNGGGERKKVNTLTLNFQKEGVKVSSNIMIWIKFCKFKWNGDGLSLSCKCNANTNGSKEETVTLTLGSDSYKS
ncbi:hypothetical protein DNK47_03195 [Mycoplasma wenyonii]|uniref:Uncharacterized protein n=1 Tax=Mycoplasma wenyonii TaxID=65123 RepID=A0A328PI91_9MOLU|nr:hypothetical protein [Mycoplasma wenyonii]RAO94783.1 hypothetical protein DNK47_03195 [Mycoplasma wenyonii]